MPASALRYYESAGLITPPERLSGRRRYEESVFDELTMIRLARSAGFTISEIRTLMRGFSPSTPPSKRWRALAGRKLAELEETIARTEAMKAVLEEGLECDCISLSDCRLLTGN